MNASLRAALTTGVAALSLSALAVIAAVPPESMRTIRVVRPANFTADVVAAPSGAPSAALTDEDLNSAVALIEQLAPVADGRVVTVRLDGQKGPGPVTIAPAAPNGDDSAVGGSAAARITDQQAVDDPVAQNAASDLIDGVYSVSRYWANYVSLELGPWLINWIPFGYLVSDQIYIWYPNFVLPTVDSFVYDFLDPVVNDPFDLTVWADGIGAIINTAANGIVNGVSDEINYIVTFGWFPIPLPPLPNFPLPGSPSASESATASTASALSDADADTGAKSTADVPAEPVDTEAPEAPEAPEATEGEAPGETTTEDPTEEGATEPVDTTAGETAEGATESADAGATEETTDTVPEDGTAEKATGERAEPATEPADEPGADVSVETATETNDATETNEEPTNEDPEPAGDSGDTEQTADDADSTGGTQQDSAADSSENSSDSSDGAAAKASASEGN